MEDQITIVWEAKAHDKPARPVHAWFSAPGSQGIPVATTEGLSEPEGATVEEEVISN